MRRRPGPLLLAAVALVAGELAGLRLAAAGPDLPETGVALAAAALLVALALLASASLRPLASTGRVRRPPSGGHRRSMLLALSAAAAAGLALGLHAGRGSLSSCLAALRSGDALEARGRAARDLSDRGPRDSPAPGVRLELRDVRLRMTELTAPSPERAGSASERATVGGVCRVPALLTRVSAPGETVGAGRPVTVRGTWWSYGVEGRGPPRSLRTYGMISGGEVVGVGASADAAVGDARPAKTRLRTPGLRLRALAARRLHERLPPDVAPAAVALTLAERAELDPRLARRFADAGLAHLLAISGLHVGILAAGALLLAGVALGGRRKHAGAAAAVVAYVVWIGAPSAALRAALLFTGWALARTGGRPVRMAELLGAAAVISLLLRPLALTEAGFQLSFAGFGGLVVGGSCMHRLLDRLEREGRRPSRRVRKVALAVAAGTGAFALTAPFAAAHFQHAAPIAIVSNFAGVPLVALSLAGLVGTLLLPGPAGELAAAAAASTLRALFRVVDVFADLPFGHGTALAPGPWEWVTMGGLLAATLLFAAGARSGRAVVVLALAVVPWLARPALQHLRAGDRPLLCTLDVGQGDAAALRTGRGHWIVFDAGPGGGSGSSPERVASFLRDRGARGVDLFVLSHPHMDHMGGAESLFRRFRVRRVLDAGNPVPSTGYVRFLDAVAEEGAGWIAARTGERLTLDGVELLVLGPADPDGPRWESPPTDANEASVSVRVRVGEGFVYVNTGDASMAAEERILRRWHRDSLRADLLKLGHHGSRTSSGLSWLEAVRPEVAVISAGRGNRYGHPHAETLARLEGSGVPRVWRTDRSGSLCVEWDAGGAWRIGPSGPPDGGVGPR